MKMYINPKDPYTKFIQFIIGVLLVMLGMTLILLWWDAVAILFKGIMGFAIAIVGMIILLYVKNE